MSCGWNRVCVLAAVLMMPGLGQMVWAHGGASGVVKERMDAMGDMAQSMKLVGGMLRGKSPYDAASVERAAMVMKQHAGDRLTALFPEGSLQGPSEAKAEIWSDWQRFKRLALDLESAASNLAENAGDQQAASASFGLVGKSCSACHQAFRVKK